MAIHPPHPRRWQKTHSLGRWWTSGHLDPMDNPVPSPHRSPPVANCFPSESPQSYPPPGGGSEQIVSPSLPPGRGQRPFPSLAPLIADEGHVDLTGEADPLSKGRPR